MKEVKVIGIVGFGVMGAAIGLNAAASGYQVVYKELNDELVKAMYDKFVAKALAKRVEKGKITQDEMDTITGRIRGTSSYDDLAQCDLIIEAAVEIMDLKQQVFEELARICPKNTIIVSNTSTFLIEKLMENVAGQERTAGLHYFFPANVNRLVEVIRQKNTSDETYEALMAFSKKNSKVPITVRDFPGFAINPIFISSYLVLNSFLGETYNVATLEDISQKTLGIKYGIMWVQNGSGLGTAYHAGCSMVEYLGESDMGYPPVPQPLKENFKKEQSWNLQDGPVLQDETARSVVSERLLGSIFSVSTHLVEKEVVTINDLELGIRTALVWPKGPFAMMNDLGMATAAEYVNMAVAAGDFNLPKKFKNGDLSPWDI